MFREYLIVLALTTCALGSILDGDIDLASGVKLVSVPISNSLEDEGRSLGENNALFKMAKFLQGHELHVNLPNLIDKDKLGNLFLESMKTVDESYKESNVTGRQRPHGGGGGGGGAALLGMILAKALGAAGIGAVGLLTMKALALSALALLISGIVGAKKLASHDDHDEHQVIYADHHGHHHRKRREVLDTPLPYQGWTKYRRE